MHLNLSADEVLTTTRSVRKRLDFERPVERSIVEECIEIAIQAPTGSNRQGWHWVVIEDQAKKQALANIYAENFAEYRTAGAPTYAEGDTRGERQDAVRDSAIYLAENFHRAPMMLIPCIEGRLDNLPSVATAARWGSLLPAVWSFMLALRERSMGSAWTTIHMLRDGEQQAAELLGIPYDEFSQGGLFPIAYTIGTDFKPAKRQPLAEIVHWDGW
jgi:nitroreductase